MVTDERKDHLLLVLDHLVEVWNAWSANSDVRYITKAFEEAIDDAIFVFSDGSIPGDMRELNDRVAVLQEHWAAWNRKNEASGGKYPVPDNAFWKALESIEDARQAIIKPKRRNLETIEELTRQKVSDAQICRIYGFTDTGRPDGEPQLWQLQDERTTPGTHTDRSKGWLPPWEKIQRDEEERQREIVERIRRQRAGKIKLIAGVAPESIEDLIAQGVSGKQICKMKKIDQAELDAYCDKQRLTRPDWQGESANQMTGVHDFVAPEDEAASSLAIPSTPDDAEDADPLAEPFEHAIAEPFEGSMTLEQEIVMHHKLGTMTSDQIAEAVSREGNTVSATKVRKVINRYKQDPAAFETAEA